MKPLAREESHRIKIKIRLRRYLKVQRLSVEFPFDRTLIAQVKSIGALWSPKDTCWHAEATLEKLEQLYSVLSAYGEIIPETNLRLKLVPLTGQQERALALLRERLRVRRYSEKTVSSYTECLGLFFRFTGKGDPKDVTEDDLQQFHARYILKHGYSVSYQNQVISAVKLYYEEVAGRKLNVEIARRPAKPKRLPNVLSRQEVKKLLESVQNLKHRTMLSLIYGCGLRSGDLLSLKPEHVDSDRMLLLLAEGKGNKDRVAPLSEKLLVMLRDYFKAYRPKVYLFEGSVAGERYSAGSLQKVMKQALEASGIKRRATIHTLRHSFATHLMDSGTGLRVIQEILGHSSSKTTEIYTHVTTHTLGKVRSPFDDL